MAGTRNFENFEIGGDPTKFNVFKVGVPAPAAARNFENFEIHVAPTKVKVFNVGPSARGSMLPKACPATAGPIWAASHLKGYGTGEVRHRVSCILPGPGSTWSIFKLDVPQPTSTFSKLVWRHGPVLATLKTLKLMEALPNSKCSKLGGQGLVASAGISFR